MSERQNEWISVEEKMPEVGKKAIFAGHWSNGDRWRAMASWQPKGTVDTGCWDETHDDWEDDENNEVTNP
jgi:hypothetical protein